MPLILVSLNFGANRKAESKYWKKIKKNGYEITELMNGEKVVCSMYIDSEHEKFYDLFHKWFCTRCEIVF